MRETKTFGKKELAKLICDWYIAKDLTDMGLTLEDLEFGVLKILKTKNKQELIGMQNYYKNAYKVNGSENMLIVVDKLQKIIDKLK